MTFLEQVEKRRQSKKRRVHRMCQKIMNVGGNGGKYYMPKFWYDKKPIQGEVDVHS
jgi:hypothetical protein